MWDKFCNWFNRAFSHKAAWSRQTIKDRAKLAVMANFWNCVVAGLVITVLLCLLMYLLNPYRFFAMGVSRYVSWRMAHPVSLVVSLLILIFGVQPMEIGCRRFFVLNAQAERRFSEGFTSGGPGGYASFQRASRFAIGTASLEEAQFPKLDELLFGFRNRYYLHSVLVMLLRNVIVVAGFALFIVPGIYLHYRLKFVPYLLSEQPSMKLKDVFSLSSQMMKDQKWDAFVLDISFIVWEVASVCTLGFVGIFWTWPYEHASSGELYTELLEEQMGRQP